MVAPGLRTWRLERTLQACRTIVAHPQQMARHADIRFKSQAADVVNIADSAQLHLPRTETLHLGRRYLHIRWRPLGAWPGEDRGGHARFQKTLTRRSRLFWITSGNESGDFKAVAQALRRRLPSRGRVSQPAVEVGARFTGVPGTRFRELAEPRGMRARRNSTSPRTRCHRACAPVALPCRDHRRWPQLSSTGIGSRCQLSAPSWTLSPS